MWVEHVLLESVAGNLIHRYALAWMWHTQQANRQHAPVSLLSHVCASGEACSWSLPLLEH